MKLPFLELKKLNQAKPHNHLIYLRKNHNLNNLILPNNSITYVLNDNNIKFENLTQGYHKTQRFINDLLQKKGKTIEKIRTKKYFINNNISLINSNSNISSNQTNNNNQNNNNNDKENEYIKNLFNSFKIRNEISSFIYSSPKNQIRFINYIMNKSGNNIFYVNNNQNNQNIQNKTILNNKLMFPIKIKKKCNIRMYNKEKEKEKEKEKDEDKINLKESSLYSLLFGNNKEIKEKNEIKTSIRKKRNLKCIESWDNNLLKNILPQNITNRNKNEYYYQNKENNNYENNYKIKRIKGAYYRNNEFKTLNSVYNIKNKTKFDFAGKYKKLNNISLNRNKYNFEIKINKRLARSSSIC